MAKRQTAQHELRLEGGNDSDKVRVTKMLPTDDSSLALSWACGALMHRGPVDNEGRFGREGHEMPIGDYVLSLVGPIKTEPLFEIRKHVPKSGQPCVSWRDA